MVADRQEARDPEPADEVDRIVAAWQRELPEVDVSPFEVLSRVARLAHHVDRVREHVFLRHQIEGWMFDVLAALARSGSPYELSPGRLSAETLVTTGTMTNRLDRLEHRGLVERSPDPEDGRAVRVTLTEPGRRLVVAAVEDLAAAERSLLAKLTVRQRQTTADLLRRLLLSFDG